MKSLITKKALTLVELVISITISSVVMLIVLTFVADSIEIVIGSNKKTDIYEDLFEFKNDFNKFSRGWYYQQDLIVSDSSWTWSDILIMQNEYGTSWVIYWVVDKGTMKIDPDLSNNLYSEKVIWYRVLSELELTNISSDVSAIYDLTFFSDKVYDNLKIKDFQINLYNNWSIIDMDLEILLYYNDSNTWVSLHDINPDDILNINLIF